MLNFESDYNNTSPVYDTGGYARPIIRGYDATNGLRTMFAGYLLVLISISVASLCLSVFSMADIDKITDNTKYINIDITSI